MSLNNVPKRSHSLMHRNEAPSPNTTLTLSRSSSLLSQQPRLARSSSLSSQPRLTRSSSLSTAKTITPLSRSSSLLASKPTATLSINERGSRKRSLSLPQKQKAEASPPPVPKLIPPKRSTSLRKNTNNKTQVIDEEIRKSLIDWQKKDKSITKIDWANLFNNELSLWSSHDNIFGSIENLLLPRRPSDNDYKEIQMIVDSLWLENEQFTSKKNIASYLGKLDAFHHKILLHYLDRFDFYNLTIEEAFRKLCSKLYFKAEAQEIDRILEAFSYKYWNINRDYHRLYKSPDVIYTITYSIMLLNTDLYLMVSSNHTKMTCQLFCENTMATILEHVEHDDEEELNDHLKTIYASVKNKGILQPINSLERKTSLLKRMTSRNRR